MSRSPDRTATRRHFLYQTSAFAWAAAGSRLLAPSAAAGEITHSTPPRRLLKTLKIGMVKVPGDLVAKFTAAKEAGYDGIELNSPGLNIDEVRQAIDRSGLPVDGTVGARHWSVRHSDPDPDVRRQALDDLVQAIQETHAIGGHTTLLVVGHGNDGTEEEVWDRSIDNIRQALPVAAEFGVYIAIENVWNHFCYDHDGPSNQTAEKFVRYVDELNSPWVGMQFDIGNHWKYGNPADWIRQLGRRIVKLDIKGFSRAENNWRDITEDDLPWADVRLALDEINYWGWVAAEVGGGDVPRLATIAKQIDRALNIG
ncbi:MAG: xylose isomerase [Pirellulaceae bacterium]|nr:MAG: xylose isomerase [Pirellulaceae bacterium]